MARNDANPYASLRKDCAPCCHSQPHTLLETNVTDTRPCKQPCIPSATRPHREQPQLPAGMQPLRAGRIERCTIRQIVDACFGPIARVISLAWASGTRRLLRYSTAVVCAARLQHPALWPTASATHQVLGHCYECGSCFSSFNSSADEDGRRRFGNAWADAAAVTPCRGELVRRNKCLSDYAAVCTDTELLSISFSDDSIAFITPVPRSTALMRRIS